MTKDSLDIDKKIINNFFNTISKEYKIGPKAVGWSSTDSQRLRFKILTEIGNLEGKTILDVGCGLGAFYEFLIASHILIKQYVGIDINEKNIEKAKKIHPRAHFGVCDLSEDPLDQTFDYVFESGIFNLNIPHWETYTYTLLKKMYDHCTVGVGANFLSCFAKNPSDTDNVVYYADPSTVLNCVTTKITPWVILKQNYKVNDFTLFFFRNIATN